METTEININGVVYQLEGIPESDDCPNCGSTHDYGYDNDPRNTHIANVNEREYTAMIFDCSNPIEWEEVHKCTVCKTVYQFNNANC